MKTTVIEGGHEPKSSGSYPALFRYVVPGSSFGEIAILNEDRQGTVLVSVCETYPVGHYYKSQENVPHTSWERITTPISIRFDPTT